MAGEITSSIALFWSSCVCTCNFSAGSPWHNLLSTLIRGLENPNGHLRFRHTTFMHPMIQRAKTFCLELLFPLPPLPTVIILMWTVWALHTAFFGANRTDNSTKRVTTSPAFSNTNEQSCRKIDGRPKDKPVHGGHTST